MPLSFRAPIPFITYRQCQSSDPSLTGIQAANRTMRSEIHPFELLMQCKPPDRFRALEESFRVSMYLHSFTHSFGAQSNLVSPPYLQFVVCVCVVTSEQEQEGVNVRSSYAPTPCQSSNGLGVIHVMLASVYCLAVEDQLIY
jgi:hypothetical protein